MSKSQTIINAPDYNYTGPSGWVVFLKGSVKINLNTITNARIEALLKQDSSWGRYFKKVQKPKKDKE